MSENYPIVNQGTLAVVGKRGPLGLGGRERGPGDMLSPLPHQALVVSDGVTHTSSKHKRMGLREDHVVNATNWCLIDMTRDRPVQLDLQLQSSGVDKFTLRVTFFCTVINEVLVAQVGPKDITGALLSYLKGFHRLYQIGLEHAIADVEKVQDNAQVELGIYTKAAPSSFAGLQLRLSSVEVLTPAAVEEERRRDEQVLKEHRRKQQELDLTRELAKRRESYDRDDKLDEQRFSRELAREEGETGRERLDLQSKERRLSRDFEREEADFHDEQQHRTMAAELRRSKMFRQETADDPYAAVTYAIATGRMDINELIRRSDEERRQLREQEELDLVRRHERLQVEMDRDWEERHADSDARRQLALSKQQIEAKQAEREADLSHERTRLDMEREAGSRQWEVTRDEREWERERDKLRLQHDLELARQQIDSGRNSQTTEWEQEKAKREHEIRLREQDLAVLREERKWQDDIDRQKWERDQLARDRDLKVQLVQSLIERGQGDQHDLADAIVSVIHDFTNTPRTAELADDEPPAAIVAAEAEAEEVVEEPRMPEEEVGR